MEFDVLPAVSSLLNVVATTLLLVGWRRIRRRDVDGHRRAMLSALATSAAFLAVYVVHHSLHGSHPTSAQGALLVFYRSLLASHVVLAVAVAVLAPRVAWLGLKGRLNSHRRLARITLPIWLYVSVTGVVVYLMAYQLWPSPRPA